MPDVDVEDRNILAESALFVAIYAIFCTFSRFCSHFLLFVHIFLCFRFCTAFVLFWGGVPLLADGFRDCFLMLPIRHCGSVSFHKMDDD